MERSSDWLAATCCATSRVDTERQAGNTARLLCDAMRENAEIEQRAALIGRTWHCHVDRAVVALL